MNDWVSNLEAALWREPSEPSGRTPDYRFINYSYRTVEWEAARLPQDLVVLECDPGFSRGAVQNGAERVLLAYPTQGEIDYAALRDSVKARFPKTLARLAK